MSDSASGTTPSEPLIDWAQLQELAQIQLPGQPSLRDRLVRLYLDSSQPLVQALEGAVGRADAPATASSAHALKSSSANVGAKGLAALCGRLESLARKAELAGTMALRDEILAQYRLVVGALQADGDAGAAAAVPMTRSA